MKKNVFVLKELYYFETIFLMLIFFSPTERPNFASGGRWETKHFIGMALCVEKYSDDPFMT